MTEIQSPPLVEIEAGGSVLKGSIKKRQSEATSTNLQSSIFNSQFRLVRVKLTQPYNLTSHAPNKDFHPFKTKFQQLDIIGFQFLEKRGFYLVAF